MIDALAFAFSDKVLLITINLTITFDVDKDFSDRCNKSDYFWRHPVDYIDGKQTHARREKVIDLLSDID